MFHSSLIVLYFSCILYITYIFIRYNNTCILYLCECTLSVYTYYIIQGDSPHVFLPQIFIQFKWCPVLLIQNYIYQIKTSLFTINYLVDIYFKNIDGLNSKFKRIISQ